MLPVTYLRAMWHRRPHVNSYNINFPKKKKINKYNSNYGGQTLSHYHRRPEGKLRIRPTQINEITDDFYQWPF